MTLPLVWTKDRPTVEGWYWVRAPNLSKRIEKFALSRHAWGSQLVCPYRPGYMDPVYGAPFEYAGPIPEAAEPPQGLVFPPELLRKARAPSWRDCPAGTIVLDASSQQTFWVKRNDQLWYNNKSVVRAEPSVTAGLVQLPKLWRRVLRLRDQILLAAQGVYDAWQQNEEGWDEDWGHGGICTGIADAIMEVLSIANIDVTLSGTDEHAWVAAYDNEYACSVDIPAHVYEIGGGYNWRKIRGVTFGHDDLEILETPRSQLELEE